MSLAWIIPHQNNRKKKDPKRKKPKIKPQWDDSVSDHSLHRATAFEIKRRHEAHKSTNVERARMELRALWKSKSRLSLDDGTWKNSSENLNLNGLSLSESNMYDEEPQLTSRKPIITTAPGHSPKNCKLKPSRRCWGEPSNLSDGALNSSSKINCLKSQSDPLVSPTSDSVKESTKPKKVVNVEQEIITLSSSSEDCECSTIISELETQFIDLKHDYTKLQDNFNNEVSKRKELESDVLKLQILLGELTKDVLYLRSHTTPADHPCGILLSAPKILPRSIDS